MTYTRIIENLTLNTTAVIEGPEWDNTLIRNITISDVDGDGMVLRNVNNVRVENVTIQNITGSGIKLSTLGSTSNVQLVGNTISGVGHDGINSGQRIGVDHPGLQILDNTISRTGLSGQGHGLLHGIYIQSTEFLVQGNQIYDSFDGNGISVRSSGVVRQNYIDNSEKSGISYFADHAAGISNSLLIENNIVVSAGHNGSRSDINLLHIPNGQGNAAVDHIIVRDNILTNNSYNPVVVDPTYLQHGIQVDLASNIVESETDARDRFLSDNWTIDPPPDPVEHTIEVGVNLSALAGGRTGADLTLGGDIIDTLSLDRGTYQFAKLEPIAVEISATKDGHATLLGIDGGRLGVASAGETIQSSSAVSEGETLNFAFKETQGLGKAVSVQLKLQGGNIGDTVTFDAFRDGILINQREVVISDTVTFDNPVGFDALVVHSSSDNGGFSVESVGVNYTSLFDGDYFYSLLA